MYQPLDIINPRFTLTFGGFVEFVIAEDRRGGRQSNLATLHDIYQSYFCQPVAMNYDEAMKIEKQAARKRMGRSVIVDSDVSEKMAGRYTPVWNREAGSLSFDVTGRENGRPYTYSITLSGAEICALAIGAVRKATDVSTHQILGETFGLFFAQILRPVVVDQKS